MYGVMIVYDASSHLAIRFLSKQVNSSALPLGNIAMLSTSYTCHNWCVLVYILIAI